MAQGASSLLPPPSPVVQSNQVYPLPEAFDGFSQLGLAVDQRYLPPLHTTFRSHTMLKANRLTSLLLSGIFLTATPAMARGGGHGGHGHSTHSSSTHSHASSTHSSKSTHAATVKKSTAKTTRTVSKRRISIVPKFAAARNSRMSTAKSDSTTQRRSPEASTNAKSAVTEEKKPMPCVNQIAQGASAVSAGVQAVPAQPPCTPTPTK